MKGDEDMLHGVLLQGFSPLHSHEQSSVFPCILFSLFLFFPVLSLSISSLTYLISYCVYNQQQRSHTHRPFKYYGIFKLELTSALQFDFAMHIMKGLKHKDLHMILLVTILFSDL